MAAVDVDHVRAVLPTVEPHFVWLTPASEFARWFWAKGIVAVTMPWAVYVTPSVFDHIEAGDEPSRYGRLVVHELVHLHQYRTVGAVRHVWRYSAEYVRGRLSRLGHWEAYRGISAEVEARTIAAEFRSSRGPR